MNKENRKNNPIIPETPLEYVGFGFLLALFGGAFWFFITDSKTLEEFACFMIFAYGIAAGPFVLHGILSVIGEYAHIPNVGINGAALAHYAALVARISDVGYKHSIVVFAVVYIVVVLYGCVSKRKNK